MKNKILIALIFVMVFAFTFALVACDSEVTLKKIELADGFQVNYAVDEKVNLSNAKLDLVFSDGSKEQIAVAEDMFDKAIDTSAVGSQTYTVTYQEKTVEVTINVTKPTIEGFNLPFYIRNGLKNSANEDVSDADFKVANRVYEVGNANALLVKCALNAYDDDDRAINFAKVRTTYKLAKADTIDGTYTEISETDLAKYVKVEDGYKYFFTETAAGKFFELTVTLDESYIVKENVTASRSLKFTVVDNGYNVYDQDGLSVMNDNTRPELWADIWGCTVDVNGNLQATDNALTLDADTKPLYQYVGNIDWVILHGDITINADKLPADFFWSDDSTATGFGDNATIKEKFTTAKAAQNAHGDLIGKEELKGTLVDGDGYGVYYSIAKNNGDSNNNKGLYNTTKVSVSGNYNAITVDKNRTESGRILKVLINKTTGEDTKNYMQMSQWYLFKMFNPRAVTTDESGNTKFEWVDARDDITFEIKNVALTGNGGKNEAVGPQGICMVNTYAIQATINNVVANGFYTNVGMDNHYTNSEKTQKVIITDTKMYDTYNAMALTWRGTIDIKNSLLKDAGGPLVLIMDGDSRDTNPTAAKPVVTIDDKTEMEAMAMGNESWYKQLGTLVTSMFGRLQTLDESLKLISGKTFVYPKTDVTTGTNSYLSVVAIMIPEAKSALKINKDNYKITGKFVAAADSADMEDGTFLAIVDALEQMSKLLNKEIGSVVIKNGSAYAMVWEDSEGKQILISPDMLSKYSGVIDSNKYWTVMNLLATGQKPSDASLLEYYTYLGTMCQTWREQTSTQVTIWTQANIGSPRSPYLGIVLGGYHAVAAQ